MALACLVFRKTIGKASKGIGETEGTIICIYFFFPLESTSTAYFYWHAEEIKRKQELIKNEHFPTSEKIIQAKKRNEKGRTPFYIADFQYEPNQYVNEKLHSPHRQIHGSSSSLCQVSAQCVKQGAPQKVIVP